MIYEVLNLKEQKYVGIKNVIRFDDHDQVDFKQIHDEVMKAEIQNINDEAAIMAIDTDFTKESFTYMPLVGVHSFEGNEAFAHFIRKEGTYYAFEVSVKACGPQWFTKLFEFVEKEKLLLEKTGYDLEYYDDTYLNRWKHVNTHDSDKMFKILLKKKMI